MKLEKVLSAMDWEDLVCQIKEMEPDGIYIYAENIKGRDMSWLHNIQLPSIVNMIERALQDAVGIHENQFCDCDNCRKAWSRILKITEAIKGTS